jgi:hypothetical protein
MIVYSYISARYLPERTDGKLQVIASPSFLVDREQSTEIGLRIVGCMLEAATPRHL